MLFPDENQLDTIPVIDDFAVELRDSGETGHHIEFISARRGPLAGFPAWDHAERDLRHFDATDVPIGMIERPYDDADEGWRINIFAHQRYVYVLEGRSPRAEDFPVFFRVPLERYLQAWAAVIDAWNPITPLDDVDDDA